MDRFYARFYARLFAGATARVVLRTSAWRSCVFFQHPPAHRVLLAQGRLNVVPGSSQWHVLVLIVEGVLHTGLTDVCAWQTLQVSLCRVCVCVVGAARALLLVPSLLLVPALHAWLVHLTGHVPGRLAAALERLGPCRALFTVLVACNRAATCRGGKGCIGQRWADHCTGFCKRGAAGRIHLTRVCVTLWVHMAAGTFLWPAGQCV